MPRIVLATVNARYQHCSHALRCLYANLGRHQARTVLREFTLDMPPSDLAEALLAERPWLIGLSCAIWNTSQLDQLVSILKQVAPQVLVVVGGPEITASSRPPNIDRLADHLICGEGEIPFPQLLDQLQRGETPARLLQPAPSDLGQVPLPYRHYSDRDLAERIVYLEATRGCPFTCCFCSSATERGIRRFDENRFFAAWQELIVRGCTSFKFLDRSFNADTRLCDRLLSFFQAQYRPGMHLHAEFIPDRLANSTRAILACLPSASIQLEIGLQSLDPAVLERIDRRQDCQQALTNLRWLRQQSAVHLHVDLIVGLPGETPESFATGFDRLWATDPHDIQVGILKCLPGTPLQRQGDAGIFNSASPYEILANEHFDFSQMQRHKRLARTVELFINQDGFQRSMRLLTQDSPCQQLLTFTDWLWRQYFKQHGISLRRRYEAVFDFLCEQGQDRNLVIDTLAVDFCQRSSDKGMPPFLAKAVATHRRKP
jgi:radical SAM superfamily enzyme YgiQ (UPF0313 family)